MYFRTSRIGCLLFHGVILNFFTSPSMTHITFISVLTTLLTEIALLSLFAMYIVTRHILKVELLLPCQPVLLELFEVLSGAIQFDKMRKKTEGRG